LAPINPIYYSSEYAHIKPSKKVDFQKNDKEMRKTLAILMHSLENDG
jgi:hypothetical protein